MKKLRKIEVIYDRDHGTANEGWYVRVTEAETRDGTNSFSAYEGMTYDFNLGNDPPKTCRDRKRLAKAGRDEARVNGYAVRGVPVEIID